MINELLIKVSDVCSRNHWHEMVLEMNAASEEALELEEELIQYTFRYDPELEPLLRKFFNKVTVCSILTGACMQHSGEDALQYVRNKFN